MDAKNILKIVRKGCGQLFFVYQAPGLGVGVSLGDFFRQADLLRRNVIMCRDPSRQFYLRGVSKEIPTLRSLVEYQQGLLRELPHVEEVYCLGGSMGAWAAIVNGWYLKARTVWAFSPSAVVMEGRFWPYDSAIQDAEPPSERFAFDAVELLEKSNGVTQYRIYYNETSEHDAEVARGYQHCEGVTLHSKKGEGHNVMRYLLQTGAMVDELPPFRKAT